ncbi:peptide methionine sulfoxide reductase MsrB-like [Lineus longissimus]|uniref:peptide methionine sulfoxide reductase MsrB-like n=1 Tax=Lineus longissimus TaxID=88925 RepID=UPI002B4E9F9D
MNILRIVKEDESPVIKKLEAAAKPNLSKPCEKKFTEEELKARLTPTQFRVTQEKGTEKAYSGKYINKKEEGIFQCIVCGNHIFDSDHKFASGCGWPSFSDVENLDKVKLVRDTSHGLNRLEVSCAKCGAHLGHVFDDGPKPSGIRYCVNSASLDFRKHTTV